MTDMSLADLTMHLLASPGRRALIVCQQYRVAAEHLYAIVSLLDGADLTDAVLAAHYRATGRERLVFRNGAEIRTASTSGGPNGIRGRAFDVVLIDGTLTEEQWSDLMPTLAVRQGIFARLRD